MACPHFSSRDGECLLRKGERSVDEEAGEEVEPDEGVDLRLCLGADRRYRGCAVYRQLVAELLP